MFSDPPVKPKLVWGHRYKGTKIFYGPWPDPDELVIEEWRPSVDIFRSPAASLSRFIAE